MCVLLLLWLKVPDLLTWPMAWSTDTSNLASHHLCSCMWTVTAAVPLPDGCFNRGKICRFALTSGTSCAALHPAALQSRIQCMDCLCPSCPPVFFQWDSKDVAALHCAKSAKLTEKSASGFTDADLLRKVSRKELALHCRRTTRGTEATTHLLEELIACFDSDLGKDMGVPLLDHDRTQQMWDQQRQHIPCIQDPAGVCLYTRTGSLTKGGIELPTYRVSEWVSEQFLNGTSAQYRLCSAILLKLYKS